MQNHINKALKNSGNLEIAFKNIAEIPTENLPSNARNALEAFKKDFANFSAELKAEVKADIKEALKEMSDNGEIDLIKLAEARKAEKSAQATPNLAKNSDEVDILAMANERNANLAKNEPLRLSAQADIDRDDVLFKLAEIKNTDIRNKATGEVAQIANAGIKKITSEQAINKSIANGYTRAEHLTSAENIKELFENSQFLKREKDLKNGDEAINILRFTSDFEINGKETQALITLKESLDKNAKRIYTLELDEIRSPLPNAPRDKGGELGLSKDMPDRGVAHSATKPFNETIIPQNTKQAENLGENVSQATTQNTKQIKGDIDIYQDSLNEKLQLKQDFIKKGKDTADIDQEIKNLQNDIIELKKEAPFDFRTEIIAKDKDDLIRIGKAEKSLFDDTLTDERVKIYRKNLSAKTHKSYWAYNKTIPKSKLDDFMKENGLTFESDYLKSKNTNLTDEIAQAETKQTTAELNSAENANLSQTSKANKELSEQERVLQNHQKTQAIYSKFAKNPNQIATDETAYKFIVLRDIQKNINKAKGNPVGSVHYKYDDITKATQQTKEALQNLLKNHPGDKDLENGLKFINDIEKGFLNKDELEHLFNYTNLQYLQSKTNLKESFSSLNKEIKKLQAENLFNTNKSEYIKEKSAVSNTKIKGEKLKAGTALQNLGENEKFDVRLDDFPRIFRQAYIKQYTPNLEADYLRYDGIFDDMKQALEQNSKAKLDIVLDDLRHFREDLLTWQSFSDDFLMKVADKTPYPERAKTLFKANKKAAGEILTRLDKDLSEYLPKQNVNLAPKTKLAKEQKEANLKEWHKDSHEITKNADGSPKVFYHATSSDEAFEIFDKDKIHSGYGFWFGGSAKQEAVQDAKTGNAPIVKAYLNIKKPFIIDYPTTKAKADELKTFFNGLDNSMVKLIDEFYQNYTQKGYKNLDEFYEAVIQGKDRNRLGNLMLARKYNQPELYEKTDKRLKELGYDGIRLFDEYVVFDSNQIKSV